MLHLSRRGTESGPDLPHFAVLERCSLSIVGTGLPKWTSKHYSPIWVLQDDLFEGTASPSETRYCLQVFCLVRFCCSWHPKGLQCRTTTYFSAFSFQSSTDKAMATPLCDKYGPEQSQEDRPKVKAEVAMFHPAESPES